MPRVAHVPVTFAVLLNLTIYTSQYTQYPTQKIPADARLSFLVLARKYGYKAEEHDLTTEDGYILKLFHIPGSANKTVLLEHGILDTADTFILRGRKSLAAALSDRGYDVWVGNVRGNKYTRRHQRLNPDVDKEFWDFSFHEIAIIDLPATIDYILDYNKVKSLSLIGHSQGSALFFVLGAMKPEYNDKVDIVIALGPAVFLNYENLQPPITAIIDMGPLIDEWLQSSNTDEIFSDKSFLISFRNEVCALKPYGYLVCAKGIFSQIAGEDLEEFEPEFFYALIRHYPSSTSRRNAVHLLQLAMRKEFAVYDHGPQKNMELYNSITPPAYNLSKVTTKVALLVGANDKLTTVKNVDILHRRLPNVVSYHLMERKKFNHIDYIWGKSMNKYLFPHIFGLLEKYS